MSDLPEPMTPPDCDLRGTEYMPLHGHRLFGSTLYSESTDAEFRAALRLWWSAWQQCPAGSLPNTDAALALAADYGRDIKGWQKVKKVALHGFVLCTDGRLYHPVLCDVAINSFALRLRSDLKRDADRERLQRWRDARKKRASDNKGNAQGNATETRFTPVSETANETRVETPSETGTYAVEEKRREEKKEDTGLRPDAGASQKPERDIRETLWSDGLSALRHVTGLPEARARGLLGKLCKLAGDDCARVHAALTEAVSMRPVDPTAWLTKAVVFTKESPMAWVDELQNDDPTHHTATFDLELTADER